MMTNLTNEIKNSKLTGWLIKLAFVVAVFCSSDVVWHTESRLPEVAQTELAVVNSVSGSEHHPVKVLFYTTVDNPCIAFSVAPSIHFAVQQHSRMANTKFYDLTEKHNSFKNIAPALFIFYPAENTDSYSLNA